MVELVIPWKIGNPACQPRDVVSTSICALG
jgi:hypothetical protein